MGQLLRHRGLGGRSSDRLAVRGHRARGGLAPWTSPAGLQFTLLACGIAGVVYSAIVVRRARRPHQYQPTLEDWVWHAVLPLLAYLALAAGAAILAARPGPALSLIAAVTLALVFIGIHNSWDTITYVAADPGQH